MPKQGYSARVADDLSRAFWRIVCLALPLAVGACGITGPNLREFTIAVDSIRVDSVAVGTSQVGVRFFGTIGGTSCRTLKRIERTASGDSIWFRFVGRSRGGDCFQMPTLLRHVEPVLATKPLTVLVFQPNGTTLTRRVASP